MRLTIAMAACFIALAPLSAVSAQGDLADRIANDPGKPLVNGAKAKLVDDAGVQGGKALRVTVTRRGEHDWNSAVESLVAKPVKAGDKLILAFQARLEKGPAGAASATIPNATIQLKSAPYTGIVSGPVTVGPEWQFHKIEGTAGADYSANALKASIQIGNAAQTIDFGPIIVLNLGQ